MGEMNNKGVVLVMVLWVLLILSLIAWGLGRRSSLEVSLLETYRGKLQSYAAAQAGMSEVLDLLKKSPLVKNTLYSSGISISPGQSPEDIFSHIETGPNTYATIGWIAKNFNMLDNKPQVEYGIRDEEGRLNINAISTTNYQILSALFELKGLDQSDADKLALAVVNYAGINTNVTDNHAFMKLDDSLLKPKNKPYENVLELLEVDGMTQEIFGKIKDDVTVYGDTQNGVWVNMDTANNDVITAVINAAARGDHSINAEEMIKKAYAIRDGSDGRSFTPDDGAATMSSITDTNWPVALREGNSNYFRVRVKGIEKTSGAQTVIEAVIHQVQGSAGEFLYWQRD